MADNTIEAAIFKSLGEEATISAVVGSDPARIFPLIVPQDQALPAMTYQQISGDRDHVLSGPTGFTKNRYQFNCWAATYPEAKRLFEALRIFWDGFSGTVLNREIQCVQMENELDVSAKKPGIDIIDRYGKQADFIISFLEPTS